MINRNLHIFNLKKAKFTKLAQIETEEGCKVLENAL